eukprot:TRINITY_DN14850_c0_g1_i1.p1 TRINITY_DN14850_c0_g1~~TRINITY_DN14850_c0_g1_i1.p1  ORF type:complete len:396 (+),score=61.79 TRINITY_DN14850_c0_g1_i1:142-1188(+)
MGALAKLSDVVGRLLCNLEDPEARNKFSRVKVTALKKMLGSAADSAVPLLSLGGFHVDGEHFVWIETPESLLAANSLQAAIAAIQQRFQNGGARAIQAIDDLALTPALLLSSTNNTTLLPRSGPVAANSIGGTLLQQSWLALHAPDLAAAIKENPALLEGAGGREKAAKTQLRRELCTLREAAGLQDRLVCAPLLEELAQLLAGFHLLRRRHQSKVDAENTYDVPPAVQDAEKSAEPAVVTDRASRLGVDTAELLDILLPCIPAFRLKPPIALLTDLVFLRDYPSFFTSGMSEKQFSTALESLAVEVASTWTSKGNAEALRSDWSVLGLGCFSDITHDDGMLVLGIFA